MLKAQMENLRRFQATGLRSHACWEGTPKAIQTQCPPIVLQNTSIVSASKVSLVLTR
jgi:hypothetical protein